MLWTLANGYTFVSSLGMVGRWMFEDGEHCHLRLGIGESPDRVSFTMYYHDYRWMGGILVMSSEVEGYLKDLGVDLLSDYHPPLSFEQWCHIWATSSVHNWQICKALLDGHVIAGIGNYLKAEILYQARIHPTRRVNTLTLNEHYLLYIHTYAIIQDSYNHNGLTISDYWAPDGTIGTFPKKVYKEYFDPFGYTVDRKKFTDGRTTHFVPTLQV